MELKVIVTLKINTGRFCGGFTKSESEKSNALDSFASRLIINYKLHFKLSLSYRYENLHLFTLIFIQEHFTCT